MPQPEFFYIKKVRSGLPPVYVKAKFLKIEGQYIYDPNKYHPELANRVDKYYPQEAKLYLRKDENGPSFLNQNGYILVPYEYDIEPILRHGGVKLKRNSLA
jgi:hypothetical protein